MSERGQAGQLALALPLPPHAQLATFVAGRSTTAVRHATELVAGGTDTLWFWGGAGCGKTHLLQAVARAADEAGRRAMYVALEAGVAPEILSDLDAVQVLAVDRIEQVAGHPAWERQLFMLLNEFLGRGGGLLLAARHAPTATGFALPDLASRAAGAVIYRLEPLDERDQTAALVAHARVRGLELDRAAAEFLQRRVARDMPGLVQWLERLDRASWAAQRKLTIPFIREQLAAPADGVG